ncbi:hypothetical protein Droror1_Dr00018944 [Drosera rotundifolia]
MADKTHFLLLFTFFLTFPLFSHQQPPLSPTESTAVYAALDSINPTIPWPTLFPPSDLCVSAPHGLLCDYFNTTNTTHVVEFSFGFVSDYSPNPPCLPNSTFPSAVLSSFPRIRKLFFYRCFSVERVMFPTFKGTGLDELEELVMIDNVGLVGEIGESIGVLKGLRRLVVKGSGVSGRVPEEIVTLSRLEELTLSRNAIAGVMPERIGELKELRVLDLSGNRLTGSVPGSVGELGKLLKLDLSENGFVGRIPETLRGLRELELLDLRYNRFGNFGVPLFLGEMMAMKEFYLSGNMLGGVIPEIWENLGGVLGIGLSGVGLVGELPASMGLFLRNVIYLGLDNNRLDGSLPKEFEMMGTLHEMNLENNRLSGRVPFSAGFAAGIGSKLKLEGNPGLCVDKGLMMPLVSNGDEDDEHVVGPSMRSLRFCDEAENSNPALDSAGCCCHVKMSSWVLVMLLLGYFGLLL